MSLAGPRVKQRLGNDPRNTKWAANKDGFGQRLMAKMGWEEGRGLGAREDGVQSHVKVHLKNDQLGIGAKRTSNDNWLENVSAFDQLLSSLNQSPAASPSPVPSPAPSPAPSSAALPAKFETKRNQLYRKRLKHKDSRTYNAQEMLEIFATSKVTKLAAANAAEPSSAKAVSLDDALNEERGLGFAGFQQAGSSMSRRHGDDDDDDDDNGDGNTATGTGRVARTAAPADANHLYSYFRRAAAPAPAEEAPTEEAPDSVVADDEPTKKKKKKNKKKQQPVEEDGAPPASPPVLAAEPEPLPRTKSKAATMSASVITSQPDDVEETVEQEEAAPVAKLSKRKRRKHAEESDA